MYYDTIKCENKIITSEDILEILQTMNNTLKKYERISEQEKIKNQMLERKYQSYTYDYTISKMSFNINFTDNTEISIDKYETFIGLYHSRITEIKSIDISMTSSYSTKEELEYDKNYFQTIKLYITEDKMSITLNLKSEDPKFDDIYNLIKEKVLTAPEKYDSTIKNKNKIANTVALATGMIPALIITTILLFIPGLNNIMFKGFIVYPIIALFLMYIIGSIIANSKLDKYYDTIMPEKTYAGYDTQANRTIYKDDIESYINTSDILIGKKINNLIYREKINEIYNKYKKKTFTSFIALLVMSLITIVIGLFI